MFYRKKQRAIDREILQNDPIFPNEKEQSAIKIKVDTKDQIFSAYSYSGDKLNPDFCEYLYDQCKRAPLSENMTVKIHTNENIIADEVKSTMKNHYRAEYRDAKKAMKRNAIVSLIMTLFGIAALTLLITLHHILENVYLTTIVEIAAWVFVWEAVDAAFLQRPLLKARCMIIQRIYTAKVEIVKSSLE